MVVADMTALRVARLVTVANSYTQDEYKLGSAGKAKLRELAAHLSQVQSTLLSAAERTDLEDPKLADLVNGLGDTLLEVDDLLDEFGYHLEKGGATSISEPEIPKTETTRFRSKVKRLSIWGTSKQTETTGVRLVGRSGEIEKMAQLENILSAVKSLSVCSEILLTTAKTMGKADTLKQSEARKERVTTSTPTGMRLAGRTDEIQRMVLMLLRQTGVESDSGMILPILGVAGVGKTALVRHIYHHRLVRRYFQLKAWIHVSESFDRLKITRDILVTLFNIDDDLQYHLMNLELLEQRLKERLDVAGRILLILDDVWSDKWQTLLPLLRSAANGIKIIITSRDASEKVVMGKENRIILKGLAEDELKKVFMTCAFGERNPYDYPKLQKLGEEIAAKLCGSPLAALTVGKFLHQNLEERQWEKALNCELQELDQHEVIFPSLGLSFEHLPPPLQQCFAYSGIFPKGHVFYKNKLVRIWVALGFVQEDPQNRGKALEDVGIEYFDELVHWSVFELMNPGMHQYYVMHPLFRELAQYVSRKECFSFEGKNLERIPRTVQHLFARVDHSVELDKVVNRTKYLRSLVICSGQNPLDPNHDYGVVLQKLKGLRLLTIDCWPRNLVDHIGSLVHLRYLELPCHHGISLPSTLCKLYHLQVLDLNGTKADSAPNEINTLINLKYLNLSSETVSRIRHIGRLSTLQNLEEFRFQKESGYQMEELGNMSALRGSLRISNLDYVESTSEALKGRLSDKNYLTVLKLIWGWRTTPLGDVGEKVIQGLQPPPNLKVLGITGYSGGSFPSWIQFLNSLEVIHLSDCEKLACLPPLGQLPLKVVCLKGLNSVEHIGTDLSSGSMLPSLEKLRIHFCPKLTEIAPLLPSLKELVLHGLGLEVLPSIWEEYFDAESEASSSEWCPSLSSLSVLNIIDCPKLTSLSRGLLQQQHLLRALTILHIGGCLELQHLPVEGFRGLTSLEVLMIGNCPKLLSSVPKDVGDDGDSSNLLPSSLQILFLMQCGVQDEPLRRCLQGLNNLFYLDLSRCPNLTAIPPAKALRCLTTLGALDINGCEELQSWGGLPSLDSLACVAIANCTKLTDSIPKDMDYANTSSSFFPRNLKELHIDGDIKRNILDPSDKDTELLQRCYALGLCRDGGSFATYLKRVLALDCDVDDASFLSWDEAPPPSERNP